MIAFISKYKRTIITLLVVIVLLFAAFMAFAIYSARTLFDSDTAAPTASQYGEWVGLWLPEDVQNFQGYAEGWQDWLIEARFELTASQFSEFLERNNLQGIESDAGLESSYGLEWFSSANRLEHYEIKPSPNSATPTPTGFYPTLWVDALNPDRVIVYIKAFDT